MAKTPVVRHASLTKLRELEGKLLGACLIFGILLIGITLFLCKVGLTADAARVRAFSIDCNAGDMAKADIDNLRHNQNELNVCPTQANDRLTNIEVRLGMRKRGPAAPAHFADGSIILYDINRQ